MDNIPSTSSGQQQDLVNQLTINLQPYKQVIPFVYSFFTWQKQYYPLLLASGVTLFYILVWFLEASLLTTVSIVGVVAAFTDYLLPIVIENFFDSSKWTDEDEFKYQGACSSLAHYWSTVSSQCSYWHQLRQNKSKTYYLSVLGVLFVLAWLGNTFNNLFLAYVVTLKLVLLPGLKHHGIIKQSFDKVITLIKGAITKEKKN